MKMGLVSLYCSLQIFFIIFTSTALCKEQWTIKSNLIEFYLELFSHLICTEENKIL